MSVSAFQKVLSIYQSELIKIIRTGFRNDRLVLQQILNDVTSGEKDGTRIHRMYKHYGPEEEVDEYVESVEESMLFAESELWLALYTD